MTSLQQRQTLIESFAEATQAGARQDQACAVLGLSPRTLQRWQAGETLGEDPLGDLVQDLMRQISERKIKLEMLRQALTA